MAEGKGLGLTLGGTMFIHSKRTSLSPMCAHAKKAYKGRWGGGLLQGWRRAEITSREAGKCNVLAGKYHYEKGENRIIQ